MSGIIVLSSNMLPRPPSVIAASLPITWAATWMTASGMTGFTLPGMMLEPGCSAGSRISAMPVRGPDASQRRSLAIRASDTAAVFTAPDASTTASRAPCASKWLGASTRSNPVRRRRWSIARGANAGSALMPVPTAVPPSASSPRWMAARWMRTAACDTWEA